jgi:hypothetical protein
MMAAVQSAMIMAAGVIAIVMVAVQPLMIMLAGVVVIVMVYNGLYVKSCLRGNTVGSLLHDKFPTSG